MEKKNKKLSLYTFLILQGILILVAFGVFAWANGNRIRERNQGYLSNDAIETGRVIEVAIEEGLNSVKVLSELIGSSLDSPNVDITKYQSIIKNSVFDFIEFADKNGVDHNITGGTSDASDRQYYLDAMKGNSGLEVIYNSRATHENLLMFYAPVYYNDGTNREIVGSIIGVYQATNKLTNLLKRDYFGEPAISYLCDSNGKVFVASGDFDVSKQLSVSDVIKSNDKPIKELQEAFNNKVDVRLTIEENKTRGYVRYLEGIDWYLIQIFPSEANNMMIGNANLVGLMLMVALLVIFACILTAVIISRRRQEKAIIAANEARLEQFELLKSMADIYYSMQIVDLNNYSVTSYKAMNQVHDVIEKNENTNAIDIMHKVMHATMADEELQNGLDFTEMTTLAKRMKGQKFIYRDLHGKNVGWIRIMFIATKADEEGVPTEVIVTTQVVDAEKRKEEQLIKDANVDELTGCLNRRSYEDDIAYYPDVPTEENFVYVAMDVNGLKVVNDSLGHEAGDELICGAATCMKRCLGNYGRVYRTGGDEFVAMIFADERQLENIKKDFEETMLRWNGKLVDSLTVSCGYVTKREFQTETVAELATIADKRMYAAKEAFYKKRGVDRRGQLAAHTALCASYDKMLKVNLTEDSYGIVSMIEGEQAPEKGFSQKISVWLQDFGTSGQVHAMDLDDYLEATDIDNLRSYFAKGNNNMLISYRRRYGNDYRKVMMELIKADDYSDDNQTVFLYVKAIV